MIESQGFYKKTTSEETALIGWGKSQKMTFFEQAIAGMDEREIYQIVLRKAPASVSYTHLRAHETLRYLVCRLLLEKNK